MRILRVGLIAAMLATAGCNPSAANSKAAVRSAIEEHLRRQPGLQLQNMTMELKEVQVEGDRAQAQVKYVSKQLPDAYVQIRYSLRRESNHWQVQSSSLVGGMGGMLGRPSPVTAHGGASSAAERGAPRQ